MELKEKQSAKFIEADKAYELSALIYADSFFYGLFDYGHKLVRTNVGSIDQLSSSSLTAGSNATIRKSKFGILNRLFTIIPKGEFSHDAIADYVTASCNLDDPSEFIFRSDYIPNYGVRVCYAVPKKYVATINKIYDNQSLLHYVSAAIGVIDPQPDSLSCFVTSSEVLIIGIKDGKLTFSNVYSTDNAETTMYYISLAYQESGCKDADSNINLYGEINKHSEIITLVQSYHSQTKIAMPAITMDGKELNDSQQYMPLYAISKCG